MIRYVFKEGPVAIKNATKADAQRIGEALAQITTNAGGRLTPEAVIKAAKDKKSPLHQHIEWNDNVAAHAYRMDQARAIIRLIRVEDEETHETQPAFISVQDGGVAYRTSQEVASSRELQLAVLLQAERDLHAFERRYQTLKDVCALIRPAREALAAQRTELETRAAA